MGGSPRQDFHGPVVALAGARDGGIADGGWIFRRGTFTEP